MIESYRLKIYGYTYIGFYSVLLSRRIEFLTLISRGDPEV